LKFQTLPFDVYLILFFMFLFDLFALPPLFFHPARNLIPSLSSPSFFSHPSRLLSHTRSFFFFSPFFYLLCFFLPRFFSSQLIFSSLFSLFFSPQLFFFSATRIFFSSQLFFFFSSQRRWVWRRAKDVKRGEGFCRRECWKKKSTKPEEKHASLSL
jgi:hypothetical protein